MERGARYRDALLQGGYDEDDNDDGDDEGVNEGNDDGNGRDEF